MKLVRQSAIVFFTGILVATATPTRAAPGDLLWVRELGNRSTQYARGVAIDARGNIAIAGRTNGALGGPSAGAADAVVAMFDRDGNELWVRQLGDVGYDWASGVAIGQHDSVVITGRTDGSLDGRNRGSCDGFVASYAANGDLAWVRQFGGAGDDWSMGVATDSRGNIYVAGGAPGPSSGPFFSPGAPAVPPVPACSEVVPPGRAGWPQEYDSFLLKYDAAGVLRWTRRLGTEFGEGANAVTTDSRRDIIVTGSTFGSLGAPIQPLLNDIYFAKYTANGALSWVRQYGARGSDGAWRITTDRNRNIIIAGDAFSTFAGPWVSGTQDSDQAWAAKFSTDGAWGWIRQFATPKYEAARAVATDAAGNIYITGGTDGDLAGANAGMTDAFVISISPSGAVLWKQQLGSAGFDIGRGIAVDPAQDSVVVSGWSSLPDPERGTNTDVLIAKFSLR